MDKDDGGAAFPLVIPEPGFQHASEGMSLRDYFAAAAMAQCQATVFEVGNIEGRSLTGRVAAMCYEQADAMLAEREKP